MILTTTTAVLLLLFGGVLQASLGHALSGGEREARRREFEAWLLRENQLLAGVLSTTGATLSAKELKIRQDTLKVGLFI